MNFPRYFKRTVFATLLALMMVGSLVAGAAQGTMVIFTASWCASCREVIPVAREIAAQNSISVTEIDIDFQDAPRQARGYNLQVPTEDPPQIFYVDRGRSTLLFSGRGYRFGSEQAVRATILQNLQRIQAGASGS